MKLTGRAVIKSGEGEHSARLSGHTLRLLGLCKLCFLWPIRVVPCGNNRYILGTSLRWAVFSHIVNPMIWVSGIVGAVTYNFYSVKSSLSFLFPNATEFAMLCLMFYGTLWTTNSRTVYFCKYTQNLKEVKDLKWSNELARRKFITTILTIFINFFLMTCLSYDMIAYCISSKKYSQLSATASAYLMWSMKMVIRAPFYFCMSQLQMYSAELLKRVDKSKETCAEINNRLICITKNMEKLQSLRDGANNIMKAFDFPVFCEIIILITKTISALYTFLYKASKDIAFYNYLGQGLYIICVLWMLVLIYLLVNPIHAFNENDRRIIEKINESLLRVEIQRKRNECAQAKEIWDRFDFMKISPVRFRAFEVIDLDKAYNTLFEALSIYMVLLIQLQE